MHSKARNCAASPPVCFFWRKKPGGSMKTRASMLIVIASVLAVNAYALSPEAANGKEQFALCQACHNPALEPPLAPPLWAVQRRYKKMSESKEHFVNSIAGFARAPSQEKAIFKHAIPVLGLMPPAALPDETLRDIATYIWDEQFPPPCEHWKHGVARAEKAGDSPHAKKDRSMLKRFCGE